MLDDDALNLGVKLDDLLNIGISAVHVSFGDLISCAEVQESLTSLAVPHLLRTYGNVWPSCAQLHGALVDETLARVASLRDHDRA